MMQNVSSTSTMTMPCSSAHNANTCSNEDVKDLIGKMISHIMKDSWMEQPSRNALSLSSSTQDIYWVKLYFLSDFRTPLTVTFTCYQSTTKICLMRTRMITCIPCRIIELEEERVDDNHPEILLSEPHDKKVRCCRDFQQCVQLGNMVYYHNPDNVLVTSLYSGPVNATIKAPQNHVKAQFTLSRNQHRTRHSCNSIILSTQCRTQPIRILLPPTNLQCPRQPYIALQQLPCHMV